MAVKVTVTSKSGGLHITGPAGAEDYLQAVADATEQEMIAAVTDLAILGWIRPAGDTAKLTPDFIRATSQ